MESVWRKSASMYKLLHSKRKADISGEVPRSKRSAETTVDYARNNSTRKKVLSIKLNEFNKVKYWYCAWEMYNFVFR